MSKTWAQLDRESELEYWKRMDEAEKRGSAAERDFFASTRIAKNLTKENGLFAARNPVGQLQHTAHQGIKAACFSREDIAAVLAIQLHVLRRLDRNRTLIWICIGLLGYVAIRIS